MEDIVQRCHSPLQTPLLNSGSHWAGHKRMKKDKKEKNKSIRNYFDDTLSEDKSKRIYFEETHHICVPETPDTGHSSRGREHHLFLANQKPKLLLLPTDHNSD